MRTSSILFSFLIGVIGLVIGMAAAKFVTDMRDTPEKYSNEYFSSIPADSLIFRAITPEGARVYQLKSRKTPCYPTVIIVSEDGKSVSISNH